MRAAHSQCTESRFIYIFIDSYVIQGSHPRNIGFALPGGLKAAAYCRCFFLFPTFVLNFYLIIKIDISV